MGKRAQGQGGASFTLGGIPYVPFLLSSGMLVGAILKYFYASSLQISVSIHTHTHSIVYIKSYVQIELNGSRKYEIFHKAFLGNQTLALDSDVDLAGFKK